MYLKQKGLKFSLKQGWVDWSSSHPRTREPLAVLETAVEDVESPNSCEEDTSSESSDSDDCSNDSSTYVEESFEVMFVPEEEIQQLN